MKNNDGNTDCDIYRLKYGDGIWKYYWSFDKDEKYYWFGEKTIEECLKNAKVGNVNKHEFVYIGEYGKESVKLENIKPYKL